MTVRISFSAALVPSLQVMLGDLGLHNTAWNQAEKIVGEWLGGVGGAAGEQTLGCHHVFFSLLWDFL